MSICSDVVATDTTAPGILDGHFHRGLGLRIDLALVSRSLAGRLRHDRAPPEPVTIKRQR